TSLRDLFFLIEVQKAVDAAQSLHHRWSELLLEGAGASKEEMDWTTNELRNSLRSIEWDLEDLDETINILKTGTLCSNPKKFNLDAAELSKRKAFITSTRQTVKVCHRWHACMHALLAERGAQGSIWQPGPDKYSRLDRQLQNLIAEQQDEQLEMVSGTIGVLKNMSERIGMELDEQAVMLDDFSHEMDNTQSRLDNVMKKLAKVSHMTSDRRQWCAIGVLLAILFVVILLFFIL
uniref:t-SNARE coiled-coil homology domain-containing protein n=1 Tax=Mola mola TaxID=94237 RepID=A0A3Q4AZI0_MOLML